MIPKNAMESFKPTNEAGVIALFWSQALACGWEPVEIGTVFPDATLRKDDQLWRVEFEFRSRNFVGHGHDLRECDLIICWEHNWESCPLPVIALKDSGWSSRSIAKTDPNIVLIGYWKTRARVAERKNLALREDTPVVEVAPRITVTELDDKQAVVLYKMWRGGTSKNGLIRHVFGEGKNRERFDMVTEALKRGERLAELYQMELTEAQKFDQF